MHLVAAVSWRAAPGNEQRVEQILVEMASLTRAEPGCLMYEAHRSVDRPGAYFLYEQFVDEPAFAAHVESEHYARLIVGEALSLLDHRERLLYATMDGVRAPETA